MIEIKSNILSYFFDAELSPKEIGTKLLEDHGEKVFGLYVSNSETIYDFHEVKSCEKLLQSKKIMFNIVAKDESPEFLSMLKNSVAYLFRKMVSDVVYYEATPYGFIVKFKSEKQFSENEFEFIENKIKTMISSKILINKEDIKHILKNFPIFLNAEACECFFEVEKIAGEIFNSEEVQKITFILFLKENDLKEYKEKQKALKENDHRTLGSKLELFHFIKEAPGCPFWLPKGWKLFRTIESYIRKISYSNYFEVKTPQVMSSEFWEKSGHMQVFKNNMMHIQMGCEEMEAAALKPMNCPGHITLFASKIRSYKDLPYRIAEFGSCHRYEPSGALHGLMRVRSFTQDDGHIFCTKEQIKEEVKNFLIPCLNLYKDLNLKDVEIIFSTKPDGFLGEEEDWDYAEKIMPEALAELNLDFKIAKGEGAFYGPKIELHVKDSFERTWQLGTIQLDFVLPKRFGITFDDKDNTKKSPCMLHRAMIGSFERFIAVLLEHTKGNLPLFLAPLHCAICTITSEINEYGKKIHDILNNLEISCYFDDRNETLGYKIKEHKTSKIPMIIVLGKEEMETETITLQYQDKKEKLKVTELEKIKEIIMVKNI